MARRQLDPSFWDDADVARLAVEERLLLICMITDTSLSDDYGVLPADAMMLRKHAFGYDDVSVAQVEAWRDRIITQCRNVVRFETNGREYLHLVHFAAYQSIRYRRQSNYPQPPPALRASATVAGATLAVPESQPAAEGGGIAANCRSSAGNRGNPTAASRTIPALDELSADELNREESSSSATREAASTAPPEHVPEATATTTTSADPLTALFYGGLARLGVLVASPLQAEEYNNLVTLIRGHPQAEAFVGQLMTEAAKSTSGRITPRWFEVVTERCLREGRLPGARAPGRQPRDDLTERHAGPAVDWDAVQRQAEGRDG